MDLPTSRPRRADLPDTRRTSAPVVGLSWSSLLIRCDPTGYDVAAALSAAFTTLLFRYARDESPRFSLVHEGSARTVTALVDDTVSFAALARQASTLEDTPGDAPTARLVILESGDGSLVPAFTAPLELSVVCERRGDELCLFADYHEGLYDPPFIDRMLAHLHRLLDEGTRAPHLSAAALPMLGDDERRFVLEQLNDTKEPYEREKGLHHLVERTARNKPDAIAAIFPRAGGNDVTLTFRALEQGSNRVADLLYRRGVVRDELVGVYTNRGPEMLCALLGILKAGAAYVPLDPAFPRERLEMMVEDGEVRFLLAERALRESPPGGRAVIVLEDVLADEGLEETHPPPVEHDPEQLAYALFTSGSTGRPKGVMLPHRAVVNFLATMGRRPGLHEHDRLLAVTTLSFDISVLELFLPLVTGATVVVASREDAHRPDRIAALLESHNVTVLQATPATWRMLTESGWRGHPGLKALSGGEALPQELAAQLLEKTSELWNLYGPTETTVWSTADRVQPGEPITIGKPIGNTRIYVLDGHGQPVPLGVAGDLWIGGDGVAQGYKGLPELTQERFVPDPFAPEPGARMYKTGDVARRKDDGRVEFLGRADHQVKIRGFRIELGEIETALERAPGVAQAVVVAHDHGDGQKRLVAYLTTKSRAALVETALKKSLQERLPDYMVPAVFVHLEAFPMTPNGKVDRKRLPPPGEQQRARDAVKGAPRTETERQVLKLFEDVLKTWPLGTEESFFASGGDSLLAVRLFARLEKDLGVRLSADTLLEAPDVASLARLIDGGGKSSSWSVSVQKGDERPPVFCISGIGGHAMVFRALASQVDHQRRFVGLSWPGLDGSSAPHDDIVSLARYFVDKLDETYGSAPRHLVGYSFGGLVAYEMAVELTLRGQPPALLAVLDTPGPGCSLVTEKLTRLSTHLHNVKKRPLVDKARYAARWVRVGLPRLVSRPESYYELTEDRGESTNPMRAVVKAHDRALHAYQPRLFAGRATLFRAVSLPFNIESRQDRHYGWRALLGDRLEVVELQAPHMEMLHEPYVRTLVPSFGRVLARADAMVSAP